MDNSNTKLALASDNLKYTVRDAIDLARSNYQGAIVTILKGKYAGRKGTICSVSGGFNGLQFTLAAKKVKLTPHKEFHDSDQRFYNEYIPCFDYVDCTHFELEE